MFNIRQLRLFTCISRIFKISITKNNIIISGCWFPSLLKICVCKRIRHDGIFYTNVYCTYILNLFVLLKYMHKAFSKLVSFDKNFRSIDSKYWECRALVLTKNVHNSSTETNKASSFFKLSYYMYITNRALKNGIIPYIQVFFLSTCHRIFENEKDANHFNFRQSFFAINKFIIDSKTRYNFCVFNICDVK